MNKIIWLIALPFLMASQLLWAGTMLGKEINLGTEMSGTITRAGVPQPGLTVTRYLDFGKEYEDSVVTNDAGVFAFERKDIKSLTAGLMSSQEVSQHIIVTDDGKEYVLWHGSKYIKYEPALAKLATGLMCELNDDEKMIDTPKELNLSMEWVDGIARWK